MKLKFLFVVEVLVVATIFHLDYLHLLPYSKTPFLFLLGWASLRLRSQRWKDVGLRRPAPTAWAKIFVTGIVIGFAMEALELFATQPLLTKILGQGPNLEELRSLIGNWKLLILGIVLSWTLAAFGEETVWRGYLTNRVAGIFGLSKAGWIAAAVLITLLFGVAHFRQGPTGVIENIIDGAILVGVYFATGRNLWAPIVAHGIQDTVDVSLIYLGVYPGLSSAGIAGI